MEKHVILGAFLLVCTVNALLPIVPKVPVPWQKNMTMISLAEEILSNAFENSENAADTLKSMSQLLDDLKLYMHDDDGNPVLLDPTKDDPETMEETERDLHNRVIFYLYTRATVDNPERLVINNVEGLKNSHFDPAKDTKIITHGWINSRKSEACTMVRDAFLKHDDCNVIVVDWSAISLKPYTWSSNRVMMIGHYTAKLIDFLVEQGMKPKQLTTVGHSLGAHVAGLASYYSKSKAAYVVAMDPAQPNFLMKGQGERVTRGDGDYLLVIHTNAGFLGILDTIGDADFRPNGGSIQHGCVVDPGGSCSHARSFKYFAESINTNIGFVAKKCSTYLAYKNHVCLPGKALMGGVAPNPEITGNFYLKTNMKSPFAMG